MVSKRDSANRAVSGTARDRQPLRHRDVALPVRPTHMKAPSGEVNVGPFSAIISPHRRPASPPRSTTRCACGIASLRGNDESVVLLEVVKPCFPIAGPKELHGARHLLNHLPIHCYLQHGVQYCEHVVHRLRRLPRQMRFQPLNIFISNRVQPFRAHQRRKVYSQDGLLGSDSARFLPVRCGIVLEEPRCEFLKSWNLLSIIGLVDLRFRALLKELALALLAPSLRP